LSEATAAAIEVQEALTHRELEVLQHIAFGLSDKEVAFRLRVSPPTVHKFAGRVNAKLGARNRVEAVVIALPTGAPPAVRVRAAGNGCSTRRT
jgi:DNA-binding NarL/FixJ family response regulator